MSAPPLPEQIAPFKLARQGVSLRGNFKLGKMARLAESLVDSQGGVDVDLHFDIDQQGTSYMRGQLNALVNVECQRCMRPMQAPVTSTVSVGFVTSVEQVSDLPEAYEPCVLSGDVTALVDLVEDELILALPIVSVHPDQACQPWFEQTGKQQVEETPVEEKENPFAILESLKKGS